MNKPTVSPESFWLNITDDCNNKCSWCYCASSLNQSTYMSTEKAQLIIDSMKKAGAKDCIILGGEPTLHPNLLEIINISVQSKLNTILVTNGRLLKDKEVVQKIANMGISAVNVSLHGWSDDSYLEHTGSSNGFQELSDAFSILRESKVTIGTTFVLTKFAKGKLEEILKSFKQLDIESIEFNIAAPAISENSIDSSYLIPIEEQAEVVMDAFNVAKKFGIEPGFNLTVPHCLFSENELKILFAEARVASGCSMRNGSGIVFKADGSITPCNHFMDFEVKGSSDTEDLLKNGDFIEYWNSTDMQAVRQEVTCYHHYACKKCEHWSSCGGGCPVNWMHFSPNEVDLKPIDHL